MMYMKWSFYSTGLIRFNLHRHQAGTVRFSNVMKLWTTSDEWKRYANCGGSDDHTLPPSRTAEDADKPVADVDKVKRICDGCRVRPECIRWAVKPGPAAPVDVWAAGRFIPVDKRKARRVRQELASTLEQEYAERGDDV